MLCVVIVFWGVEVGWGWGWGGGRGGAVSACVWSCRRKGGLCCERWGMSRLAAAHPSQRKPLYPPPLAPVCVVLRERGLCCERWGTRFKMLPQPTPRSTSPFEPPFSAPVCVVGEKGGLFCERCHTLVARSFGTQPNAPLATHAPSFKPPPFVCERGVWEREGLRGHTLVHCRCKQHWSLQSSSTPRNNKPFFYPPVFACFVCARAWGVVL